MARRPFTDPYVYPGADTLKNSLGLRDPALLRVVEYAATRRRTIDAPDFPLTADGFKATHRHLFQDLYSWAGQVRTVGLRHPREDMEFAFPHLLESVLAKQFRSLATEGDLTGLDPATFAVRAAHHIGELNTIHAFREGNGRTMRLHLQQLATRAGHPFDPTKLPGQAWNEASAISFKTADNQRLALVIRQGLVSGRERSDAEAARAAAQLSADGRLMYAALAEKIDRQMVTQSTEEKTLLRVQVARELVAKEERDGPVVLSDALRRIVTDGQKPQAKPAAKATERDPPKPSGPPHRQR